VDSATPAMDFVEMLHEILANFHIPISNLSELNEVQKI
jgi:chemotaxis response regulator CheB